MLEVLLLLGVCGCNAETPVQEEHKQENAAETMTQAVVQDVTELTQSVKDEAAGVTQAVSEKEEAIIGEALAGAV